MSTDVKATAPVEIEIRGLTKSYGAHKVLKGLSADVRRGEAVVLVGPSGSGKTTFLRCINLLETFEQGEIRIGGESVGYEADASGGKRLRIDPDADGRLLLAANAYQADARNLRNLRQQNVFGVGVDGRQGK